MWLALDGLMQRHPNAIPIIARGGTYSASAGEGTAGDGPAVQDAGLTPAEAAELLHILAACVVGFGFATLWGRQMAAAQEAAAAEGGPDEAAPPAADSSADAPAADGAPAPADDLADYREAIAKWDPAQFAAALDIVLAAYGTAPAADPRGRTRRLGAPDVRRSGAPLAYCLTATRATPSLSSSSFSRSTWAVSMDAASI